MQSTEQQPAACAAEPLVWAVLVNYRRAELTARAVASVLGSRGVAARVVVVDNASDGGWGRQTLASNPRVETIINVENRGFGAACNQGIEGALKAGAGAAEAGGVLLLNNDAVLDADALAMLVPAAAAFGLAAPRIELPDGRLYAAGGYAEPQRARCRNRGWHGAAAEFMEAETLAFASGCALLIAPAALQTGVRFWEPYFLYYEDADLCLRLAAAGHAVRYEPRARVVHLESASSVGPDQAARLLYYDVRNRWWFVRRNARGMARVSGMAYWWAMACARWCSALARGDAGRVRARVIARAMADALRGRGGELPTDLAQRIG